MSNKKYWQSFGALKETDSFQDATQNEFKEDLLPLEEITNEGFGDGTTPRRDFLKYLGFSTAAAAIAASCEMPVRRAIPYLQKPDNVVPGVANYYASTYVNGGDAISVVVKQRDGRPIKIEGNDLSTITGEGAEHTSSGTSAQAQASVLDLYDTSRLRHPLQRNGADFKEVSSFDAVDKMINDQLNNTTGKVVLLTSTINSPTSLTVIDKFLKSRPGAEHVQYDAVSYSGMIQANKESYGKPYIPSYNFDRADVIVSLGADFLGTWLSPVEFSRQYASNRRIATNDKKPKLSRHFQFESSLSLTGSNADDRHTHRPSETGAVALALLAALGGGVSAPALDAKLNKGIQEAAKALKSANGRALVVCGSNDVNIQIIVNAINEKIGANLTTIDWLRSNNARKGMDVQMDNLVKSIKENKVAALIVYGCNPVYSHPEGQALAQAIAKLPLSISLNGTLDETSEQCSFVVPAHHWLESWGDAEIKTRSYSFMQPLINPLFKTRAYQDSLLKWSTGVASVSAAPNPAVQAVDSAAAFMPISFAGLTPEANDNYEAFHKKYWMSFFNGSSDDYYTAIQNGVIAYPVDGSPAPAPSTANLSAAASKIAATKKGDVEVVLYEKVAMGNGSQANNPWLQELPDPISKVTWDNYAMVSPEMAKKLVGIDVINNSREADKYEVTPEKPVVKVTVNGKSLELPVLIIPGIDNATIAVALGYGRASVDAAKSLDRVGRAATGAGKNAFPFVTYNGLNMVYTAVATAQSTGATYPLAQTQVHGALHDGQHLRPIIYETNLNSFKDDPEKLLEEIREEKKKLLADGKTDFVKKEPFIPIMKNRESNGV